MPPYDFSGPLQNQTQRWAAEDPYLNIGQALRSSTANTRVQDPWAQIALSALGNFSSGLATGVGQNRIQERQNQWMNGISDALRSPQGLGSLEGNPDYSEYRTQLIADALNRRVEQQRKIEDMVNSETIKNEIGLGFESDRARAQEVGKRQGAWGGMGQQGYLMPSVPTGAPGGAQPQMQSMAQQGDTSSMYRQFYQEAASLPGATPESAASYAEKRLTNVQQPDDPLLKRAETAREQGRMLQNIAGQVGSALDTGINTGVTRGITDPFRRIGAEMGYQPAKDSLAAESAFKMVTPEIIGMARKPGSGATSDFEAGIYRDSGPSASLDEQTNRQMIQAMAARGKREQEFADFVFNWKNQRGNLVGAEQAWRQYEKQNPLFPQGQQAPQQQQVLPQQAPQTRAAPPPPLPGESFDAYRARVRGG